MVSPANNKNFLNFDPQRDLYDTDSVTSSKQEKGKLSILAKAQPKKDEKDIGKTITKAGFLALTSELPKKDFGNYFRRKIEKYGPGLLCINHPTHGKIFVIVKRVFKEGSHDMAAIQMPRSVSKTKEISHLIKMVTKHGHFIQMADQKTWDKRQKEQGFVVPDLSKRIPPLGPCDTVRGVFDPETKTQVRISKHGERSFVPKNDPNFLVKIHPMKFLKEPDHFKKQSLAITKDGHHVIHQQASRSCVPTAVAMLILDHGKTPNWDSIIETNLANEEQARGWIEEAKLKPIMNKLPDYTTPKFHGTPSNEEIQHMAHTLQSLIEKNGPGLLGISPPYMGGHEIVLDRIFPERDEADIRDPYHGVALRVKLSTLLSWWPESFIQVSDKS